MAYIGTKPGNQVVDGSQIADGTITPSDLSTGKPVWNSSGQVGINKSNPAATLDVNGFAYLADPNNAVLFSSGSGGAYFFRKGNVSSYTDQMVIDSNGNVGIGTASPNARLDVNGVPTASTPAARFWGNNGGGSVQSLSGLAVYGNLSNGFVDTTLVYGNTANSYLAIGNHNGTSYTERMRLDSSGNLLVGTNSANGILTASSSASNTVTASFTNSSASPYGVYVQFSGAAPNNTTNYVFGANDNATTVYRIWSNGTTSGRSDERLKKNIEPAKSQLADVMAMEVVNYEWNESIGGTKEIGWVAQQVQQIKPGLVQQNDDGFLHIKREPMVAILWKAVQELKAEVDSLKAQLSNKE